MRHEISPLRQETGPESILQVGLGFMASKTLLTAVELDLFSELAKGPRAGADLAGALGLHPRGAADFLDALVALGFLERSGGEYRNSPSADTFLDRGKDTYVGGVLEMANSRLYPFWGSLTEALRTGHPQNEHKHGGDVFDAIYRDEEGLERFLHGMTGLSMGKALVIAERFPWADYRTVLDVGGAVGCVPVAVARRHPHMSGGVFELPRVRPVFEKYVASFGLEDRLTFHGGDFFTDDLPGADVIVLGQILHGWGLREKRLLLKKAYDALPDGGAVLVYDAIIDDDRRENTFGLLASLNMLIETRSGFEYTAADGHAWMAETGFRDSRIEPLTGGYSMLVGIK
ncbi:methyltransferase/methylase [Streptomyces hygroscopicus subsp. sporocinereus]|uniref:Methyltransferase/methylase n=1 Tax=Streptomyces hygroscopicus TaxID=1912 RepID=A0ABQ3UDH4_STRHY|nr:acetylserotonin O-methyltransferase [Streptomyces hygroscopicus]GHJ33613.1 methyltransferase/methylase [Streptomyces hygroscopicus]